MPLPGRHRPRPAQLPGAHRGPHPCRLRRRSAPAARVRGRDRRRDRRRAAESAPLRLPRRRRRLALDALPGRRPDYRRSCARSSRCRDGGAPFAEDPRCAGTRRGAPLATLHGEGKVSVMPAIGYTHPDQSHFTSRHFWEVGATDAHLRTGWLGRYLDRHGAERQPAAGALARRRAAAGARDGEGAGRGAARRGQLPLLGARRLGRGRARDARRARRSLGRARGDPRQGRRVAPRAAQASPPAAPAARAVQRTAGSRARSPTRSDDSGFPSRLAGLAAMLGAGLPLHCVALTAPGEYDTHDDQPQALARRPRPHGAHAARVPARPRGARPRRPRAHARLVGVRPPRRGERLATAPTTAPSGKGRR